MTRLTKRKIDEVQVTFSGVIAPGRGKNKLQPPGKKHKENKRSPHQIEIAGFGIDIKKPFFATALPFSSLRLVRRGNDPRPFAGSVDGCPSFIDIFVKDDAAFDAFSSAVGLIEAAPGTFHGLDLSAERCCPEMFLIDMRYFSKSPGRERTPCTLGYS